MIFKDFFLTSLNQNHNNKKMKRIILFAATALLVVVSCGPKLTSQEKIQAYSDGMDAIMEEYNNATDKESAQETAIKKIVDLSLSTMKKYPADTVALIALQNSCYYMEPEDLKNAIDGLCDEFKESDMVKSLSEGLLAKLNTQEGKPFVDFTVDHVTGTDADGNPVYKKVSLSDYVGKGKYMLVDFWSPWCGPCKAEIPNIKAVYEKYHGDKFDVLSVAVWEESRKMNWQNTIDTAAVYGITWNQINNGHQEPAELYGIDGIPHVILFGPDGTIVKRDLRGAALEAAVAAAVAQ